MHRTPRASLLPFLLCALCALAFHTGPASAAEPITSMKAASQALRDREPKARAQAVAWLGARRTASSRQTASHLLMTMIEDPFAPVRRLSWNALAELQVRAQVPVLVARLPHERQADVIRAAVMALGRLATPAQAAAAVDRLADHPSASVQVAVLSALARMGAPEARPRARAFLALPDGMDNGWGLRAAAMLAIARAGTLEDAMLAARIYAKSRGHEHWFARSAYARLVATHMPDQVAVLTRMVSDKDARVAVTAAEGLARAGHPITLMSLLRAGVPGVRAAAAAGIAQARVTAGYDRVRLLARNDTSRRVRWAAAKALWDVRDPLGTQLLLVAVTSREPAIWAEAVALLSFRTGASHGRDAAAWKSALRTAR